MMVKNVSLQTQFSWSSVFLNFGYASLIDFIDFLSIFFPFTMLCVYCVHLAALPFCEVLFFFLPRK